MENPWTNIPSTPTSSHSSLGSSPGPSMAWTDEKHGLYLDSLEAAFVNQLHHSIALRGRLQDILSGPYSSRPLHTDSRHLSHKLMVLQDVSWNNIYSKTNEPLMESTADSNFTQKNPCIRHCSSAGKQHIVACQDLQRGGLSSERIYAGEKSPACCGCTRSSEQHPACIVYHHKSVGFVLEASDQNFMDEDQEEKSSCVVEVKRLKTVGANSSSNDQVILQN